jgi:hypothetical protein
MCINSISTISYDYLTSGETCKKQLVNWEQPDRVLGAAYILCSDLSEQSELDLFFDGLIGNSLDTEDCTLANSF